MEKKKKGSEDTIQGTYSISSSCWRYSGFCSIPIKSGNSTL